MDRAVADRRPRVPLRRSAYVCGVFTHFIASASLLAIAYRLFGAPGAACAVGVIFLSCLVVPVVRDHVRFGRIFPFLRRRHPHADGGGVDSVGVAGGGMDAGAMSALPAAFTFKRDVRAGEGWAQCSICLVLVRPGQSVRRLPACGHLFHASCVNKWLRAHPTCPLCRAPVRAAGRRLLPV
ncbi:unnamed protein product [Alopecurus aequalis]